jgi:mannosyltransferase
VTVTSIRIEEPSWLRKQWRRHPERCWLALILALGFVLRLVRLGAYPFWHDEVHNLVKADHLFSVLFHGEFVSNHPPLFTVLLAVWRACGLGEDEWSIRLLPVLLGLAGIAAVYVAGKRLFGERAGLMAAFLLAISPFHVLHSQDLKEYIVLPVTGTIAVVCLYEAVRRDDRKYWVCYALAAALACYSESFAAPLLMAVNVWAIVQVRGNRDRIAAWVVANVSGALLFLPYLGIMLKRMQFLPGNADTWWIPRPSLWSAAFYLKTLAFGYSDLDPMFKIALAVYAAFVAAGLCVAWLKNRPAALLLLMWLVLPVAIVYAISCFTKSIFLFRALLPFAIPFYLLAGVAAAKVRPAAIRAALLIVFAGIAAVPLAQQYANVYPLREKPHRPGIHPGTEYDDAARYMLAHWQEGDVLVHSCACTWLPADWYGFHGKPHFVVSPDNGAIAYSASLGPALTTREAYLGYFMRQLQPELPGRGRVWFMFSEWEREHLDFNAVPVWRWLDAHYPEVDHKTFLGTDIFLYAAGDSGARPSARLRDDGVSALMTRGGETCMKTVPDAGLVPTPLEDRAGNLVLAFTDSPSAEVEDPRAPTARFTIENRTQSDVKADVCFMASDVLVEAASLYEADPDSDVWRVTPLCNPDAPGAAHDVPIASARFDGAGTAGLTGELPLPPGEYTTAIYLLGVPGDAANNRAQVSIAVNGAELLPAAQNGRNYVDGWHWAAGARFTIEPWAPTARVVITARAFAPGSAADVGYVAIRRVREAAVVPPTGTVLPDWPGAITVAAGATTPWNGQFEGGASRVDVWVREEGAGGRVYRIFQVREGEDAFRPAVLSP